MAVDETLFVSAEERGAATVRLYGFARPTLTFGYGQRLEEVCRPDVCRGLGVDCIRRLTGGRALLHENELTYAVASPVQGPFANRSVRGIYAAVSAALSRALEQLGAPLDPPVRVPLGSPEGRPSLSPVPCLAVPERHEITAGGLKIVASAQRRRRRAFLQHGAILRRVDAALWERVRPQAADRPLEAVGLDDIVAPPPSESALRAALATAFTELFGEPPSSPDGLDEDERARAGRLETKYRSESWNTLRRFEGG